MDFLAHLTTYYRGEKSEAILLCISGFILLSISFLIWQQAGTNQILKGLFYPVVFLGLFMFCVGGFNTYNNTQRLEKLPLQYSADQEKFVQFELDRFEAKGGVNDWWLPLKITWAVLLLVGLALTFWTKSDLVTGIAIGLMIIGTVGFIIDGFAHQRAKVYTHALVSQ